MASERLLACPKTPEHQLNETILNFHPYSLLHSPGFRSSQIFRAANAAARIDVAPEVRVVNGYINASLILTNVSKNPLRICTLYFMDSSVSKDRYEETVTPDFWKSEHPRDEDFAAHIKALAPQETFTIPLKTGYNARFYGDGKLTIVAGYRIIREFAIKYDTWSGLAKAEPVTVRIVK